MKARAGSSSSFLSSTRGAEVAHGPIAGCSRLPRRAPPAGAPTLAEHRRIVHGFRSAKFDKGGTNATPTRGIRGGVFRRGAHRSGRTRSGGRECDGRAAPDHRPAERAAQPRDPGGRVPGERDGRVPRRRRPEPERAVEHRAVQELPPLLQRLPAGDRLAGFRHQLRPRRRQREAQHTASAGVPEHVPRAAARPRDHVRACAHARHRVYGPERPRMHGHAAAQPLPVHLPRTARRGRTERPDPGHRQHVHLRGHRRHAGDDVRRQPAGAAHLHARARAFAGPDGRRVSLLVA